MTSQWDGNSGIATNVTRTRITVLVFNLTIITFMFSILGQHRMSAHENILVHFPATIALFVGFCLTLLGIFWLLHSQNWDADGLSHPRSFTLGAITTFLALSQTVTAFMHEYMVLAEATIEGSQAAGQESIPAIIHSGALGDGALLILGGMGSALWILITYIAPLGSLFRSPVSRGWRWVFAAYYVALQTPIYWVYASVWRLAYLPPDQPVKMTQLYALQFIQPLLWFR